MQNNLEDLSPRAERAESARLPVAPNVAEMAAFNFTRPTDNSLTMNATALDFGSLGHPTKSVFSALPELAGKHGGVCQTAETTTAASGTLMNRDSTAGQAGGNNSDVVLNDLIKSVQADANSSTILGNWAADIANDSKLANPTAATADLIGQVEANDSNSNQVLGDWLQRVLHDLNGQTAAGSPADGQAPAAGDSSAPSAGQRARHHHHRHHHGGDGNNGTGTATPTPGDVPATVPIGGDVPATVPTGGDVPATMPISYSPGDTAGTPAGSDPGSTSGNNSGTNGAGDASSDPLNIKSRITNGGVSDATVNQAVQDFYAAPQAIQQAFLAAGGQIELDPYQGGAEGVNNGQAMAVFEGSGMFNQAFEHELYEIAGQSSQLAGTWGDGTAVSIADKEMQSAQMDPGDLNDTIGSQQGDGDWMSNVFVGEMMKRDPQIFADDSSYAASVATTTEEQSPELVAYMDQHLFS